jgi:hypothetical protein
MKKVTLSFLAVEGTDVQAIDAVRAGRLRILGKTWDKQTESWELSHEPSEVVCVDAKDGSCSISGDVSHYRKICKQGHLKPANKSTAEALGLEWKGDF